jgi:hypothetical protein
MSYRFISPIKANRDAVEAKLKAKGGNTTKDTKTVYAVKDKDGKVIEVNEARKDDKDIEKDKTQEATDIYIVESDVMP